jgi:hypothetical protein
VFDPDEYLAKLVFGGLTHERFETKFEDEIGDLDLETCVETHDVTLPRFGKSLVRVLRGGLAIVSDSKEHWHVYKVRARVEHEEFLSSWQAFMRAGWTMDPPEDEGVYPTKDLEHRRGIDRTLKRVQGRLVDITRGFVGGGKTTEWRGYFWAAKYPRLPNSL